MRQLFFRIFLLVVYTFPLSDLMSQSLDWKPVQIPLITNGKTLSYPFTGGLQAPQISQATINNDELDDIVIFDRAGNVWSVFLAKDGEYQYNDSLSQIFPKVKDWALVRDYNCDGIPDVMSYSIASGVAGVSVWKGVANQGKLSFSLTQDYIRQVSTIEGLNLYIARTDIPHIGDVDGDSDLDIIAFDVDGSYINFFRNESQENEWGCDSLYYVLADNCWGRIQESGNSELLSLSPRVDSCYGNRDRGSIRHTGSTILSIDLDEDNVLDLLIGDVSSSNIVGALNGNSNDTSWINAIDHSFPGGDISVDIDEHVASYLIDVDQNGTNELVFAPNNRSLVTDNHQLWLYEKTNQGYQQISDSWLSEDILDVGTGSFPTLFDENNDGIMDLVVGQRSRYSNNQLRTSLHLYRNIGTPTNPIFQLANDNYLSLAAFMDQQQGLYPVFGDVDLDGDIDAIIGTESSGVLLVENKSSVKGLFLAETPTVVLDASIGFSLKPTFVQLNGDAYPDLLVGNHLGTLRSVINNGLAQTSFESQDQQWGGINTRLAGEVLGFSSPTIISSNQDSILMVGSLSGNIAQYKIMEGQPILVTDSIAVSDVGFYSHPLLFDFNDDGDIELLVGNERGGINAYSNGLLSSQPILPNVSRGIFPNPCRDNCKIISDQAILTYDILTTLGQRLITVNASNLIATDLLAAGNYIVLITDVAGTVKAEKLIIVK